MTHQWQTRELELPAYPARIDYHGPLHPAARTLADLHRAHVAAIPSENPGVLLGRGISVALDRVPAKLLTSRRGGYCYEHGVPVAAVPGRLGYRAGRLLARIGDKGHRTSPSTHPHHRAGAGRQQPAAGRCRFRRRAPRACAPGPHRHAAAPRRPGPTSSQTGSNWRLRQRIAGQRATPCNFTEEPQHASDVEIANHLTSAYPNSPFAGHTDLRDARPEGPCFAGGCRKAELRRTMCLCTRPQVIPCPVTTRACGCSRYNCPGGTGGARTPRAPSVARDGGNL